jgi:hypothetical protein
MLRILWLGKALKEGFWSSPFREVVNEAMPMVEPMLLWSRYDSWPAVFNFVHSHQPMIPSQRTPSCLPKLRIEKGFFHGDHKGRVVIF